MKEYDPDQVDVIVGLVPLSGFAADSMVTIEQDDDDYAIVKGVDGDVSRSKMLGLTYAVTIHLMSTSQSNAILSAMRAADRLAPGGAPPAGILIRDKNGTSLFGSDTVWIEKPPTKVYGKQANENTWRLRVADAKYFEGGSA